MSTFFKNTFAETKSIEAIEKRKAELTQEFIEIFKAKMIVDFKTISPNLLQQEY